VFELVYSLPEEIETALEIARLSLIRTRTVKQLVICGMGGSGIGGELLSGIYGQDIRIPVITIKDYRLPASVNRDTLVILVSYSGNTEETLSDFAAARQKKCATVIVSSGGRLARLHGAGNAIIIPGGLPPRAAIGYLFTPLPFILWRFGLIADPYPSLGRMVVFLKKQRKQVTPVASKLARWLYGFLPVIYSNSPAYHPVAYRWRCQFNENSKVFAHSHAIPEMNHNEIVGIGRARKVARLTKIVFLDDPGANPRNTKRVKITEQLVGRETAGVRHFKGLGSTLLERAFYLIWLGDFTSVYLARLERVDPLPVKRIETLKARLK